MKLKRMLAAVMSAAMMLGCAVSFSGCGRTRMPEKETVDHVYRATTIAMPEGINWIRDMYVHNGKITLLAGDMYDETIGGTVRRTYTVNLDGTGMEMVSEEKIIYDEEYDMPTWDEMERIYVDDGTCWKILYSYFWNEETGESSSEYRLTHLAADGTILSETDPASFWLDGVDAYGNSYYHYVQNPTLVNDTLLFMDSGALYAVGADGNFLWATSIASMTASGYVAYMFPYQGGAGLLCGDYSSDTTAYSLYPVSLTNGQIGTPLALDSEMFQSMWNIVPGDGYTFYCTDSDGVYGYDADTNTFEELLNFMNSDISSDMVNELCVLSADQFVASGWDQATGDEVITVLNRVPDDQLVPKWILYLAVVGDMYDVRTQVLLFNRQSDEYRIRIKEYSPDDYYTPGEDYDYNELMAQAVNELNNEIIAGNMPDLLYVNANIPIENYIAKGLLEDLYPYIDNDERFERSDFLENVLGALDVNGSLYQIMPSFNLRTLLGKTENLGGRTGWTMNEFMQWVKTLPEDSSVFWEYTRDDLLRMFCTYAYEEFVDPESGECHFDSEEFRQILTFLSTVPEESREPDGYDEEYWNSYEYRFRDNKAMLELYTVRSLRAYNSMMNYTFYNGDLTLIGLPSSNGNGAAIVTDSLSFAISSRSPMKDAAWNFVSYFLTEEYQDTIAYTIPLRRDALIKLFDQAVEEAEISRAEWEQEQQQITTGWGMIVEDGDMTVDEDIAVDVMWPTETRYFLTREIADRILDVICSTTHVYRENSSVLDIIRSDSAAFFAGQKSLDDTVRIIQDRVSTYVAENR